MVVGWWFLLFVVDFDLMIWVVVLAESLFDWYGVFICGVVVGEGVFGGFVVVYCVFSVFEDVGWVCCGYYVEGLGVV